CRQIVKGGVFHAFLEAHAPPPSPAPKNPPSGPAAASPGGLIEIGAGNSWNVAAKTQPPPAEPAPQPRVKPDSPWSFRP
ncbi:unnamed protein product, partial [marine sediment metagenome]